MEPLLSPGPAELIERAIETLRARLLPHVESPDHDAALAALRALAIAQAELASDPAIAAREVGEIEALRALARAVRARSLPADGPTQVRLRDHLLKATANRLRLTNPKYMTRRQRRAESSY
jgi:hypothetical protein